MSLLVVGDDEEVVAVEFFGGFDEGVKFALAGFLGGYVVAYLDLLLDLCAAAGHEVNFFVVTGAVVEQCVAGFIASAQELSLRRIFNTKTSPGKALKKMNDWYEKVHRLGNSNFRSVIKTFKNHAPTILNYFRRRAINASAEAFNSKVKIFRAQMKGVRDRNFFIYWLVKLYA